MKTIPDFTQQAAVLLDLNRPLQWGNPLSD